MFRSEFWSVKFIETRVGRNIEDKHHGLKRDPSSERYQNPVAFGTFNIYFTEMHSQVLTLLAG